ncbi:hypothetical protein [uncultured Tateyamaria sp.]|uniref:hypothetical protein n=1 Tax=uncultured Tateyamaria sp. TaxID=455651 RepID=UPI00260BD8E4|nr:hypothetical protein [uncultured Tateyamaria sp.]
MSSRFLFPTLLGALALMGLVGISAYLILQACALPILQDRVSSCRTPQAISTAETLQVSTLRNTDLQRRIFELERELAALQCVKAPPDPNAPLTPEGWDNRDLAMLYGCWDLDSTYRTRDVDTGTIRTYADWQMCFDLEGNGTQTMRADDGTLCEGTVRGAFQGEGLSLIEPGNLACDDGGYIHQRQISCVPAPQGRATCDTLQPETSGKAQVGFARAPS